MSDPAVSEPSVSEPSVKESWHVALDGVLRHYDGPPVVQALGPIDLTIGPSACTTGGPS